MSTYFSNEYQEKFLIRKKIRKFSYYTLKLYSSITRYYLKEKIYTYYTNEPYLVNFKTSTFICQSCNSFKIIPTHLLESLSNLNTNISSKHKTQIPCFNCNNQMYEFPYLLKEDYEELYNIHEFYE